MAAQGGAGISQSGNEGSSRSNGAGSSGGSSANEGAPSGRLSGDDILGAVDGDAEPLFGVEEIEAAKSKSAGKGAVKTKGKGPAEKPGKGEVLRSDVARAQEAESIKVGGPSFEDLEEAIGRELSPAESTALLEEEGELDPNKFSEQAQGRFRELANRSKESETRAQAAEAAIGEMRQQFEAQQQQVGQYLQGVMQQNARLNAQVEMLMRGSQDQRLSPEDQIERELVQKGVMESRKALDPQIKALTQRLDAAEKRAVQSERLAEVNRSKAQYSAEGQQAAREAVLSGFSDEEIAQLGPTASNWVLSYAWANRTSAKEAAKMVRQDIAKFSLAYIRAQSRQLQSKREKAETVPKPAPTARGSGSGEAEPSYNQLRANGYRDGNPFMQWELDGRPALKKR